MIINTTSSVDWKKTFANTISNLTGFPLSFDNVHSDEKPGWGYHITARSLFPNYPLLMIHYRGPLFAVIPVQDYQKLEKGANPIEYINNAHWNYGYYRGTDSMTYGVFWQPLENRVGINDKAKISRYLKLLSCQMHLSTSGYMPREEQCMKCKLEKCPFSPYSAKSRGASWNNEVHQHDYRKDLFNAFVQKTQVFGIKLYDLLSYSGKNALLVPITYEPDSCSLYLPVSLINDILYHPGKRNWEQIAEEIDFELGVFLKDNRMIVDKESTIPLSIICRNFWSSFGVTARWEDWRKWRSESNESLV